jgi:acid phosphatase type 7
VRTLRLGATVGLVTLLAAAVGLGAADVGAASETACSPRQSTYSGVISSTPGLVGYWRLGESSGTTACDFTGKDNGTYMGGFTLGVPGAIAQDPDTAVALNGSSGQVSVPSSTTLNVGDSFTIEGWVKRASSKTGSNEVIASKQDGSWVLMFNESDRLTLRRSTVGNVASATVSTTDTTAWHYVAATKNGSSVHLYIDGVDVTGTITNQTMANNTQPLSIGQSTGTAYLKGTADEIALYNTPLTPTQISQHYNTALNPSKDPVLAATGDIACPAGDTTHECQQAATAKLAAAWHPNAVAALGDNQYESGLLSEFDSLGAYNNTWGQFNPVVHPTTGNHEYAASTSASGYFSYFGAAAAGNYYSYNLGSWHIVALNSNCSDSGCGDSLGGTTSSAELSWLQADLAAHPNQCTLAYWHHPAFSSGWVGNSPGVKPLWNALYGAHADVVLNGHDHMYERFAQQDPMQNATSQGLREFVVGTGGETLFTMGTTQPNMQAVDNHHFGVLFLTLHAGSYEWAFRATNGTVIDSGSTGCHAQQTSTSSAALVHPALISPLARVATATAEWLSARATRTTASLTFRATPRALSVRRLLERGLPVRVYCSRACDVAITIRAGAGRAARTIARYRETESEISRPHSHLSLRLGRHTWRYLRSARLTITFTATDAGGQRRTISRHLSLR